MALKIKGSPRQLEVGTWDVIWPGDDAVDLETSDLTKWAQHGKQAGLQLRPGVEVAPIVVRPLVDREVAAIMDQYICADPNAPLEAFRMGCVTVPGVTLIRDRHFGIDRLSDQTVDFLAKEVVKMPYLLALRAAYQIKEHDKESAETMLDTGLPWAIGAHILAETFRNR